MSIGGEAPAPPRLWPGLRPALYKQSTLEQAAHSPAEGTWREQVGRAAVSGGGAARLAWGREAQWVAAPGATTERTGYTAFIPGKGQVRWSPAHTVLAKRGPGRPVSPHFLLICTEGLYWPVDQEVESKAGRKLGIGTRQRAPFPASPAAP